MKLSSLHRLLNHEMEPALFVAEIADEVEVFTKCLSKKGSSCSIYIAEDISFIFTSEHWNYVLDLHNNGLFDKYALGYILDGMIMADNVDFVDDEIVNVLVNYTFPELE